MFLISVKTRKEEKIRIVNILVIIMEGYFFIVNIYILLMYKYQIVAFN